MIWLTPEINAVMKHALLSTSADALRSCMMSKCAEMSLDMIHHQTMYGKIEFSPVVEIDANNGQNLLQETTHVKLALSL